MQVKNIIENLSKKNHVIRERCADIQNLKLDKNDKIFNNKMIKIFFNLFELINTLIIVTLAFFIFLNIIIYICKKKNIYIYI